MMKRKFGGLLIASPWPLRERPDAPAGAARALPQVLGGDLVDRFGPAALQRVAHAELQAADSVDFDDRALAILEGSDPLVIGPQEEEIARLQRDHRAHPRQALFDGVGDVAHRLVVPWLAVHPHAYGAPARPLDPIP